MRNAWWNAVQFVMVLFAGTVTSVIIARSLGPESMGVYSYLGWLVSVTVAVASLAIPNALTKYISEYLGRNEPSVARFLARRLLLRQAAAAVPVIVLTGVIDVVFIRSASTTLLLLAMLMVLPQLMQQATSGVLAGLQRYDRVARAALCASLAQVSLVTAAALLIGGLPAVMTAILVATLVGFLTSYHSAYHLFLNQPATAEGSEEVFSRIHVFSAAVYYMVLLNMVVWHRTEIFFLKQWGTLADIAFYGIAFGLASKIYFSAETLIAVLFPMFSESFGRRGTRELGSFYERSLRYLQMLMVPACISAVIVGEPFIRLLYGDRFAPAVPVFQLLAATVVLTSLAGIGSCVIMATDRPRMLAAALTFTAVLKLGLGALLIPRFTLVGAAAANLSAQVFVTVVVLAYAARLVGGRFPWSATASIYGAAALGTAPAAYAAWAGYGTVAVLVLLLVGAGVYVSLLAVLGQVSMGDVALLKSVFRGLRGSQRELVDGGGM